MQPRSRRTLKLGATRRSGYWGGQARLLGDTLAPSCVTLTPQAMCGGVLRDLTARLDVQIAESGVTLRWARDRALLRCTRSSSSEALAAAEWSGAQVRGRWT